MSMTPQRWDPFREMVSLRDAVDRLFQQSFVHPGMAAGEGGVDTMPLDIADTENAFVIKAPIPGIAPDDLQITVQGNTVTLRGESKAEEESKERNWLVRERRYGTIQRSVTLPMPVNADQAQASCENGILTLTLPKAEEAKPRRIQVGQ